MQIVKFFLIIIGAAMLGSCGPDNDGGRGGNEKLNRRNASPEDTPLHWAAKDNNVAEAKRLIDNGAEVNAKAENDITPLHVAAVVNALEVAKLLIDNGAAVTAKGKGGDAPLHWAAGGNTPKIAKLLIDNGAAVNAKDKVGWTPLHWAAAKSAADVAKLLIDNGAAVNTKSNDGHTPLHFDGVEQRDGGCETADCQRRNEITGDRGDQARRTFPGHGGGRSAPCPRRSAGAFRSAFARTRRIRTGGRKNAFPVAPCRADRPAP